MAEKLNVCKLREMLNDIIPADIDVERVFQKMIHFPYNGRVSFRHLKNMDPDDFSRLSDVETIQFFRRYPSKFVLFEDDTKHVRMCGVRIPSAKICLQYLSAAQGHGTVGCTDEECYKFHICRSFVAGYCKNGPCCPNDHHFQSEHNRRLLTKQDLAKYSEEDLLRIFVNSQLRVCDVYNRSGGFCEHADRCMRLHVCEEFVCGKCAGECKLSHSVDDSEHSKRLRRYYALDDKPQQEVLRNLLVVRRRPDAAVKRGFQREDLEKLLQMLACEIIGSTSAASASASAENRTSPSAESATTASDETSSSSAATAAAAAAVTGGVSDSEASWQLEVFGTWRSLSEAESAQIERAYSDPNNDSVVTSVVLSELEGDCHLGIELNKMTASLLLDDDSQAYEEMKLRRTNGTTQWLWFWQHDDDSWRSYTVAESAELEAKFQKNENKFALGDGLRYTINLSRMTQANKTTGRVRYIRRRPKSSTAQL